MQPQWVQTLYWVAFYLDSLYHSWKFYARTYEITIMPPFYIILLEHWQLNANSDSLDANSENLNDSERLNPNTEYFRQQKQTF